MSVEPEISYCEQQARNIENFLRAEMLCVKTGAALFGVSVVMFVSAFILDSAMLAVLTIFVMSGAVIPTWENDTKAPASAVTPPERGRTL